MKETSEASQSEQKNDVIAQLENASLTPLSDEGLAKHFDNPEEFQKFKQKANLFRIVVYLMIAEVALMFYIVISHGLRYPLFFPHVYFELDRWALISIEGGVLLQTFGLAKIITEHLFPIPRSDR